MPWSEIPPKFQGADPWSDSATPPAPQGYGTTSRCSTTGSGWRSGRRYPFSPSVCNRGSAGRDAAHAVPHPGPLHMGVFSSRGGTGSHNIFLIYRCEWYFEREYLFSALFEVCPMRMLNISSLVQQGCILPNFENESRFFYSPPLQSQFFITNYGPEVVSLRRRFFFIPSQIEIQHRFSFAFARWAGRPVASPAMISVKWGLCRAPSPSLLPLKPPDSSVLLVLNRRQKHQCLIS